MKQYDEIMNKMEEQFDDCPEMPESLSKENIVKTINEKGIKPEAKKSFAFKAEAIAAAVVVLVVGAVALTQTGGSLNILEDDAELYSDISATTQNVVAQSGKDVSVEAEDIDYPEVIEDKVYTFKDSESVKQHFKNLYDKGVLVYQIYGYGGDYAVTMAAATEAPQAVYNESASDLAVKEESSETTAEHAVTNTQVVGVDEGDVIKNDGKYIYLATGSYDYESRIKIIDAESMELVYSGEVRNVKNSEATVQELYVSGDVLTVIYTSDGNNDTATELLKTTTYVDVYDISNRYTPKKIRSTEQDGYFKNSRMIGSVLYTLSTYYVTAQSEDDIEKYALPMVNGERLDGSCVYHFDDDSTAYTVVTALDTSNKDGDSGSVAILGGCDEIYCSGTTLYALAYLYEDYQPKTQITSFSLDGTEVKCKAQGKILGEFNNNYSFDEHNGYLRAAVTYYDKTTYKDVSCIYVLDENLEEVGSLVDIADDEQVKSVRFMGDKGYVVTFRQTDPLFSLDLSDPKNPKVLGELKLPGYSTYLHPLSDTVLLGIGYGGDEENADTNDLKIALFDVSDMTSPKLLDEFIIECASSEANYEPKALIHYAEKNIVGIPVTDYNYSGTGEANCVRSFAIINYTDNKLSEVKGFVHDSTGYTDLFRGTYIGEKLYTVDEFKIVEHSLSSGEKLRECTIMKAEEKIVHSYEIVTSPAVTDGIIGLID